MAITVSGMCLFLDLISEGNSRTVSQLWSSPALHCPHLHGSSEHIWEVSGSTEVWERKWVVDGRNIWLISGLEVTWWPWFGNKWNTSWLLCTLQRWLQTQHFWLVFDRCLVHVLTGYWLIWVMFVVLLIPAGKCYDSTSNYTTTFPFHVLPNNS
jgi:hypothetical protein